jgi:hypothetical protein
VRTLSAIALAASLAMLFSAPWAFLFSAQDLISHAVSFLAGWSLCTILVAVFAGSNRDE